MKITSVNFKNFKALSDYSISLNNMNILSGPNNCGKSTVVAALRCLDVALRRANSKSATFVPGPLGNELGYSIPTDSIPISLENVQTNYGDTDATVIFRLTNGNKLLLFFPHNGGCSLLTQSPGKKVSKPKEFRQAFPVTLSVIPVLGPVEHNEQFLERETVTRNLSTHRASRHFRNYWYYYPEEFPKFSSLVEKTWSGMKIKPPERITYLSETLSMFCSEDGIDRELYWAGFGFQIWCQLLTHISRAEGSSVLVADEPETYLHPDVQRQLLQVFRSAGSDVIVATHSTEIIGEADPSEILLIDKTKRAAKRLKDIEEVQVVYDTLGSVQNITLTRLAKTQKILYVEGVTDEKIIRRFSRKMGFEELASGTDLSVIESGGFSGYDKIATLAEEIQKLFKSPLNISAIFDRDYYPEAQIEEIRNHLSKHLHFVFFHNRKEIENYLLVPSALQRAFINAVKERETRTGQKIDLTKDVLVMLEEITERFRGDIQSQYIARSLDFHEKRGLDKSTIIKSANEWLDNKWKQLDERVEVVPGKKVLSDLRKQVQDIYSVNLTDVKIIDAFQVDEISIELQKLVASLNEFRKVNR